MSVTDDLVIFTTADVKYELFVIPFIASCLEFNPGAFVEVGVANAARFRRQNEQAIKRLTNRYGTSFRVRDVPTHRKVPPNSLRFMYEPIEKRKYTYISDIDIFHLEEIAPLHTEKMQETGLPYSNMRRWGRDQLTGLHFTLTDAFYPLPQYPDDQSDRDEILLFQIVADKGLELPDPALDFRPVHGFHISLNRRPAGGSTGFKWEFKNRMINNYLFFTSSPFWRDIFPHLDKQYQNIFALMDFIIEERAPQKFKDVDRKWLKANVLLNETAPARTGNRKSKRFGKIRRLFGTGRS